MLPDSFLQRFDLPGKLFIGREELSQMDEGTDNLDAGADRTALLRTFASMTASRGVLAVTLTRRRSPPYGSPSTLSLRSSSSGVMLRLSPRTTRSATSQLRMTLKAIAVRPAFDAFCSGAGTPAPATKKNRCAEGIERVAVAA